MKHLQLPRIRDQTKKKNKRFVRTGIFGNRPCPWCYQTNIAFKAIKKGVAFWCQKQCGYRVFLIKKLLTHEEKQTIYGKSKRKNNKKK